MTKNESSVLKRKDLVYPDLSYKIVGILFSVFNSLGYGYKEKYYERAIKYELEKLKIKYKEQISFPIVYKNKPIGKQIFDFLIADKLILELKRGDRFSAGDITQVTGYLKTAKLKLALLARFSSKGLVFKRIVNL